MTLGDAVRSVRDFVGRSVSTASSAASTSLHSLLVNNGQLDNDDNWDLGDLFTTGAQDPRSLLKAEFDWLFVTCKQAGVAKFVTMADVDVLAEAGGKSQEELPPQGALVHPQAKITASLSVRYMSSEGTIAKNQSLVTQLHDNLSAFADPSS